jgi:hypothetical protein
LANGDLFNTKLLGSLGAALILQAASDKRLAKRFGQVLNLLIQDRLNFLPSHIERGIRWVNRVGS